MAAKILAQDTGKSTLAPLYTCPANSETVVSTCIVYNFGPGVATITFAAAKGGAIYASAQVLLRNFPLDPGQRLALTEGWCFAAGDVLRFEAIPQIAVNLFGSEIPTS